MRINSLIVIAAIAMGSMVACNQDLADKDVAITNEVDTVSYVIGNNVGQNIKRDGLDSILNKDAFLKGLLDAYLGKDPKIAQQEGEIVARQFFSKMQAAQMEAQRLKNEVDFKANREAGEKFLAENKGKEGVTVTASGLQYKVLQAGTGAMPTPVDRVKVNYKGTLIDGTVFDESKEEPVEFQVGGVIPGWTEALTLMPVGSKWQLFIPTQLAYNERQAGEQILPFSTLVFEVELLEIVAADAKTEEGK